MLYQPKKILLIKLRAIGDVVLSTIVLQNIRKAFPNAKIDFLTESYSKAVVEGNEYIDRVIVLDRKKIFSLVFWKRWLASIQFVRSIISGSYDMVFDFFGNPRSAFLTLASRAPVRIGYDFRIRRCAYNIVVRSRADRVHEAEFHLDALSAVGIPIVNKNLSFALPKPALEFARDFRNSQKLHDNFIVAINFWGGWPAKRWPLDRFAALGDKLVKKLQATVLLIWGPGENHHAVELSKLMSEKSILIPPTDLKQLGAILKRCDMLVSTDSGPMHISTAVGTPTVGIFGPTNFRLQGPYGDKHEVAVKRDLDCLGCNLLECGHNSCMAQLSVEDVWQSIVCCIKKNNLSAASLV